MPHKSVHIANPLTEHVCKRRNPCTNTFYRTLPNQLDGIFPLTVYHNTFHNVPFVIFLLINSLLTRIALQKHMMFFKILKSIFNHRGAGSAVAKALDFGSRLYVS